MKSKNFKVFFRKFNFWLRFFSVLFAVAIGGATVWGFVFKSGYFVILAIDIEGAKNFVNAKDLNELVKSKAIGNNLLLLNASDLQASLVKTFQGAKTISVDKSLPNKLNVSVIERKPLALLYNDIDHYLVDDEGYVLGIMDSSQTNLPKIRYEGDIKVGLFVNKNVMPVYLEMMTALDDKNLKASSISFSKNYSHLYLNNSVEVYIGNDKNRTEAASVIEALLKKADLSSKTLKKIDLRYDKVIVSYQ